MKVCQFNVRDLQPCSVGDELRPEGHEIVMDVSNVSDVQPWKCGTPVKIETMT